MFRLSVLVFWNNTIHSLTHSLTHSQYFVPFCIPLNARRVMSRAEHAILLLTILMFHSLNASAWLKESRTAGVEDFAAHSRGVDVPLALTAGLKAAVLSMLMTSLLTQGYQWCETYNSDINHTGGSRFDQLARDLWLAKLPPRRSMRLKLNRARHKIIFRRKEYEALHNSPEVQELRGQTVVVKYIALLLLLLVFTGVAAICK